LRQRIDIYARHRNLPPFPFTQKQFLREDRVTEEAKAGLTRINVDGEEILTRANQ